MTLYSKLQFNKGRLLEKEKKERLSKQFPKVEPQILLDFDIAYASRKLYLFHARKMIKNNYKPKLNKQAMKNSTI